jgi:hypothetical protein
LAEAATSLAAGKKRARDPADEFVMVYLALGIYNIALLLHFLHAFLNLSGFVVGL